MTYFFPPEQIQGPDSDSQLALSGQKNDIGDWTRAVGGRASQFDHNLLSSGRVFARCPTPKFKNEIGNLPRLKNCSKSFPVVSCRWLMDLPGCGRTSSGAGVGSNLCHWRH